MSEPFLERLSRFTPDSGGLNRDLLLYQAGRESARSDRRWKSAALVLGAAQALTLVFLWPNPRPMPSGLTLNRAIAPAPFATVDPPARDSATDGVMWSARSGPLPSEIENRPAGELTLIESGPPLRAFAPLPASLL